MYFQRAAGTQLHHSLRLKQLSTKRFYWFCDARVRIESSSSSVRARLRTTAAYTCLPLFLQTASRSGTPQLWLLFWPLSSAGVNSSSFASFEYTHFCLCPFSVLSCLNFAFEGAKLHILRRKLKGKTSGSRALLGVAVAVHMRELSKKKYKNVLVSILFRHKKLSEHNRLNLEGGSIRYKAIATKRCPRHS